MKRLFAFAIIVVFSFLGVGCGGTDNSAKDTNNVPISVKYPPAKFVSSDTFSFTTDIDPSTLVENQSDSIGYPNIYGIKLPDTFVISTTDDITNFANSTNTSDNYSYYQKIFTNLDTETYLLVIWPGCQDFYEYSGYKGSPPNITITLNHFTSDNLGCTGDLSYYVLKGAKASPTTLNAPGSASQ